MKSNSHYVFVFITFIALGFALFLFSKLDSKKEQAYRVYEECVAREYSTTPSAYYNTQGVWPECDN